MCLQPTNGTSLTASDTIPSYDVTVLTGEQAAAVCADERGNAPVLAAPAGATRCASSPLGGLGSAQQLIDRVKLQLWVVQCWHGRW